MKEITKKKRYNWNTINETNKKENLRKKRNKKSIKGLKHEKDKTSKHEIINEPFRL